MIKILTSIDDYLEFVNKINSTDNYFDPMLSNEVQIKNNLLESINKKNNNVIGILDDSNNIIGLPLFKKLDFNSQNVNMAFFSVLC